jgi:phosphatidylserine/phosphatidylglycerophosphate/cardiolipin synthase-like enzyme
MKLQHAVVAVLSFLVASVSSAGPGKTVKPKPTSAQPASAGGPVTFVPDPSYLNAAKALINGAKKSILLLQFNFESGGGVTQALADLLASKKGVQVSVLLEKSGFGADKKNPATVSYLSSKGVTDVTLITGVPAPAGSNPQMNGILHAKVLVVDGQSILAGSTNWTNMSITRNNETNLSIRSSALADALTAYAARIKQSPGGLNNGTKSDGNITLYTDGAYQPAMVKFIGRAGQGDELDCSMYFFNVADPDDNSKQGLPNPTNAAEGKPAEQIVAALVAAKGRGATIRVLFDGAVIDRTSPIGKGNDRAVAALRKGGVTDLSLAESGKITHQKFCVLTPKSGARSVILGSTNWNLLDIDYNHQVNWVVEGNAGGVGDAVAAYFAALPKQKYP